MYRDVEWPRISLVGREGSSPADDSKYVVNVIRNVYIYKLYIPILADFVLARTARFTWK